MHNPLRDTDAPAPQQPVFLPQRTPYPGTESRQWRGCSPTALVRWDQKARSRAVPIRDKYRYGVELHVRDSPRIGNQWVMGLRR
jgi:hypothetical protein